MLFGKINLCNLSRCGHQLSQSCRTYSRAPLDDSPWRTLEVATCRHTPQRRAIRYLDQLGGLETAAPCSCSCNACSRRLLTICSTNAASDRGKMNEHFGPFPAAGEITRFSERKPG